MKLLMKYIGCTGAVTIRISDNGIIDAMIINRREFWSAKISDVSVNNTQIERITKSLKKVDNYQCT